MCIVSCLLSDDEKCAPKELLSLNILFRNNKNINHCLEGVMACQNHLEDPNCSQPYFLSYIVMRCCYLDLENKSVT